MIVTLSGITGTGKSFFKDAIAKELGFKNLVIVTTRKKRIGEIAGIDKEFVTDEEFGKLVRDNKVTANFEFLGAKYGYRKELLESDENLVTEVHYNRIYDIKRHARNIFSIYIIPYDVKRAKAEHYVASSVDEFILSMGSKYIQSYTLSGFKEINRKDKFLVSGTPCQIDSLRRYINKMKCQENFVLLDFFCHGVPSKFVWDKYIVSIR